jgi:hypothetical protein
MPRLAVLFALAVALAGCAEADVRPPPSPTPGLPLDVPGPKAGAFEHAVALRTAREARLRAEIKRLRRSPTVPAALRVARLGGRITPAAEQSARRDWTAAQAMVAKLTGARRTELAYVIGTIRGLAATQALTGDRIRPLFLVLRKNTSFWARAPLPAAGWRTNDGPVTFQYYPGHGLQLQPLASWGRANALAGACLEALRTRTKRDRCRSATLTRSLDRLAGLGARRDGFLAWEYYFAFGSGVPPWVSGMAQATATQALARGYRALHRKRWRRAALRGLGAFQRRPPSGVAVDGHYLLYSFAPSHRVFNGELQAVIGLRDAAALLHSDRAWRLFRRGERVVRREVSEFDTGAWSLYSERGAEATLNYHSLIAGFLDGLCDRLHRAVYCRASRRFKRYEREPTRVGVTPLRRIRADRPSTLRFTLSKISTVKVRLWGKRGMSLSRDLNLARGSHALTWRPPGRGRYRLRIEARGPSGPVGVATRTLRITLPKKADHPKRDRRKEHR